MQSGEVACKGSLESYSTQHADIRGLGVVKISFLKGFGHCQNQLSRLANGLMTSRITQQQHGETLCTTPQLAAAAGHSHTPGGPVVAMSFSSMIIQRSKDQYWTTWTIELVPQPVSVTVHWQAGAHVAVHQQSPRYRTG